MGLSRPGRAGIRSAAPTGRNGRTNWAVQTGQPPLALWADPTRWSGRTSCAARLSARPPPVEAARHSPKIQAFITTRDLLGTAADELAIKIRCAAGTPAFRLGVKPRSLLSAVYVNFVG